MKFAAAVVSTMIVASFAAVAAPPRVATIRVADVFRQLDTTVKANEEIQAKREALKKDKRQLAINELSEGGTSIDAETRKKLEREFLLKRQEAKSLEEDLESFRTEKNREINAEMVAGMRARLDLIRSTAEKIAREEGYDWVFDSSGQTNTGVPLVLYAKNPNDLTDRVLAAMGPTKTEAKSGSTKPPAPPKKNR
jgi:outer membrane protein